MKTKSKGLMIGMVALMMISILVPAYAQSQSGDLDRTRDQECTPQGPATRAYGEEPPIQAQEEKPDSNNAEMFESVEEPTQEQTQTQEQQRDCNGETEDCEKYQYQYQYSYGQEETLEQAESTQEQTQNQEQLKECNNENVDCEQYQYQYKHQYKEEQEN
jgi:hypothetical protein